MTAAHSAYMRNAGENGVIIYLAEHFSIHAHRAALALNKQLWQQHPKWLVDTIPAYHSVTVLFDVFRTDHAAVTAALRELALQLDDVAPTAARQLRIPVYYHPEVAPDLATTARQLQLSIDSLVQHHCDTDYTAYALGFAPGFAYLGTLPASLVLPRLAHPRSQVAAGSVAIANDQTAIYPRQSPGGWHIIGRSPAPLFCPWLEPPGKIQVGDSVSFYPISRAEFLSQGG